MAIVTNKAAVRRALEQWFIAARAGDTLSARETAEMSASEAAAALSDDFYDMLARDEDTINGNVTFIAGENMTEGQTLTVDFCTFMVTGVGEQKSVEPVESASAGDAQESTGSTSDAPEVTDIAKGFFG